MWLKVSLMILTGISLGILSGEFAKADISEAKIVYNYEDVVFVDNHEVVELVYEYDNNSTLYQTCLPKD